MAGLRSANINLVYAEGCGNAFLIIDRTSYKVDEDRLPDLAADLASRYPIDSVLVMEPSDIADVRMRILERDRSESDMCGNGIRCVALYLSGRSPSRRAFTVETRAGVKDVKSNALGSFTVDMGRPYVGSFSWNRSIKVGHSRYTTYFVNSGEPHVVVPRSGVDSINVKETGSLVRHRPEFAEAGVNVDFMEVIDRRTIRIRTYERGVEGETQACGTGATAAAVVAIKTGLVDMGTVDVRCNGGLLTVMYDGSKALLTGPALILKNEEYRV